MYLDELRPKRRRHSSPVRVVILLILIGFSLYLLALVRREDIAEPYVPLPTPTRAALSYVDEAEELLRQGKLQDAIAVYQHARTLDAQDVRLMIPLVRLYTLSGQPDAAVELGLQVVERAPQSAPGWTALGMAYEWLGRLQDAADACNRAVELDPDYAEGYACLAEAYVDQVRWAEANAAAQKALELNPNSVDVHRNLGYVLEVQGNWTAAIAEYQKALAIHPNLAYIHLAVGHNYRALGDFDAALASFRRAAEIEPDNAEAADQLGWTYYNLGEYEQAEAALERATQADPTNGEAFGHLAITYWTRRNYELAIPNFEQALKLELADARRLTSACSITLETPSAEGIRAPAGEVVLRGEFPPPAPGAATLEATLAPLAGAGLPAGAGGRVAIEPLSGKVQLELQGVPMRSDGRVYVGWLEGLKTLAGDPIHTEALRVRLDGTASMEMETPLVDAAPIEYYYTLGLAYYYLDQCEKAYPLFDAALQIDPEDPNPIEGIRLCQVGEE
jgi:tetratricopeptide (TPR) repeat protein